MSVTITDTHSALLPKLAGSVVIPAVGKALTESAEAIAADARFSIIDGAISGRGHIVGELVETRGRIETSVIADSDHAVYLEFGTSKMMPRPFMMPAAVRNEDATLHAVHDAVINPLRPGAPR